MIAKHDAVLGDTHLTFTWTISTSKIDRIDVVDRLLKAEFAEAASFRPGDVRLPPTVRTWERSKKDAIGMQELGTCLGADVVRFRTLGQWARRHPRLASKILGSWVMTVARRLFRRDSPGSVPREGEFDDVVASMTDVANDIAMHVAEVQAPVEIFRHLEAEMLRPGYLARALCQWP